MNGGSPADDARPPGGMLRRLRERGVLRVAASYALIAWLVLQIASVVFDPLGVPKWVMTALIIVAVAAFPVAVALAWLVSRRHSAAEPILRPGPEDRSTRGRLRHYADAIVIGILLVAVVVLLVRQSDIGKPKPPPDPAIAVLPFENLSGDPKQDFFSDGLAEEMLDRLGRVPGLRVIARSSSFSFRGKDIDLKTVAEKLGVTTVLEGSVRRDGKRLKLSARLIDGTTGQQVWSGSFDRETTDVFDIQAELAQAVVEAIIPAARGTVGHTHSRPTSDMNAYDFYLIGKRAQWQLSPESVQRAVNALEHAVDLDPKYAPAQAQLALALINARQLGVMNAADTTGRAEAAVHRALALDPNLPEAHVALAYQLGDDKAGLAELQRALELNPNSAFVMYHYARMLVFNGRGDEYLQWLRKALKVDPLAITARTDVILDLHLRGDDHARDRELARFNELFNDDVDGMTMLARLCLRKLDDPLCAARAARRAIQLAPPGPTPGATVYLHRALLAMGAFDEAAELQARTDWKRVAPETWAYESALAAGLRPDLEGLASAIESLRSLAPDPARAAALVYWLTLAGRYEEAAKLVDDSSQLGPPRMSALTGVEIQGRDIAALWTLRATEAPTAFRREFDEALRDFRKNLEPAPLYAQGLVALAALESMDGNDATAIVMLQRAFKRSALPNGFMPHLPWFARLAGRPEFDRLARDWQAARSVARSKMAAQPDGPRQ